MSDFFEYSAEQPNASDSDRHSEERVDDAGLSDRCLDRLVDGELSGDEYRAALAACDSDPNGWRRCALAFLEQQALRRDLGGLASRQAAPASQSIEIDGPLGDERPSLLTRSESHRVEGGSSGRSLGPWLAAAASFLIAFVLGIAARGWLRPWELVESPVAETPVEDSRLKEESDSNAYAAVTNSSRPEAQLDANERSVNTAASSGGPQMPSMVDSVRLVVNDGRGGEHEMDLPIVSFDEAQSAMKDRQLPDEFFQSLRRNGHKVHIQQQLMPIPLQDGRHIVVPVEQLQLVPVSQSDYQ